MWRGIILTSKLQKRIDWLRLCDSEDAAHTGECVNALYLHIIERGSVPKGNARLVLQQIVALSIAARETAIAVTAAELADLCGCSLASVRQILAALEKKGWIERYVAPREA